MVCPHRKSLPSPFESRMSLDLQDIPNGTHLLPELIRGAAVGFSGVAAGEFGPDGRMFPGINNVTGTFGPYSVLSWIYWKFYESKKSDSDEKEDREGTRPFQGKRSRACFVGHQLNNVSGIPGLRWKYTNLERESRTSLSRRGVGARTTPAFKPLCNMVLR